LEEESINHTAADNVRFSSIAVSIKVKRAAIHEDSANIQLCIWVSAYFAKRRQLSQTTTELFVLPLILVQRP
jgi:hypothetical protein